MVVIEISPNTNCAPTERVFHDVEPPRVVRQVRLERQPGWPYWYAVTGWTTAGGPCPARLQKVDDSGEGTAFLVYGGDAGLRLQPAEARKPWALKAAGQWGEPFLLLADAHDVHAD